MSSPLLINAAELLRRPGSERLVELQTTVGELGIEDDPRLEADAEVDVRLRLESLTDGIVIDGVVRAPWVGTCRRCLEPAAGIAESDVQELYQLVLTDPEAFEIVGDQLDLRQMVREIVLLDAPATPLCRDDCAGLCPVCGVDRNTVVCTCEPDRADPRWDALSELRAQLDAPG
ncbi:MAG: hypothetical protein JWM12_4349 [Ilumatobacteraceae bacterium]|nr:hypothetical protein [Ilumatobacteraceae bacterium]